MGMRVSSSCRNGRSEGVGGKPCAATLFFSKQALKINMPHDELEQLPLTRPLISYLSSRGRVQYLSTVVPPTKYNYCELHMCLWLCPLTIKITGAPHYATDTNMCKFAALKT